MNQPLLSELGFSEKEIDVYLCVLKNGRITPANVARLTKINRSSVYFIAKDLIARGVISEDTTGPTSFLLALPPEELLSFLDQEERSIKQKKEQAKQAILELQKVTQETRYVAPKVTFITEEQLSSYLYKRTPAWNDSMTKRGGNWWGFQDPSFVDNYGEWIKWYWEQPSSQAISLKFLTNDAKSEQDIQQQGLSRRQVKLWDKSQFTGSQWIAGDYIINLITSHRPHYLVEIHDAIQANNLREMFKGVWGSVE